MWKTSAAVLSAATIISSMSTQALAWGGRGHRIVAAVAAALIPAKAARMDQVLRQLEKDNNFVDAASYPDEYIRDHDPNKQFSPWHFADLPDDGSTFDCATQHCLFNALSNNLKIVRQGKKNQKTAVAIAWVIHLVGDLHQPLHMSGRDRGGNDFHVKYRGEETCKSSYLKDPVKVELHSAWDDCLVEELVGDVDPKAYAKQLLGDIKSYKGRPEVAGGGASPWLAWGDKSHELANNVAFDSLKDGDDLEDPYIKGPDKALDTIQRQLLAAGIRLAFLLDRNFK
jgi:hypothetical protein